MILHRHKRIIYPLPPVIVNDQILDEVKKTKFLGVTITNNLTWNEHIKQLRNKLSKVCGILYITKPYLTKTSMLLIYSALIYSNLIYCNTIWGAASKQALRPLDVVHKRAIRVIEGLKKMDHTNDTFYKHKLLKLHDINILTCSVFVFKCLNGLAINNFFTYQHNARYPSRSTNVLELPFVSSCQSQTHIKCHGVNEYNKLPNEIKGKRTLYSYKNSLKQYLLEKYNNNNQ